VGRHHDAGVNEDSFDVSRGVLAQVLEEKNLLSHDGITSRSDVHGYGGSGTNFRGDKLHVLW